MDRYNLRTTSLNSTQLTTELAKRGAQTFGTQQRKQQRLQRFIDAAVAPKAAPVAAPKAAPDSARKLEKEALRVVLNYERGTELRRSSRIRSLLGDYLGY